jgi:signal peptidase I
MKRPACFALIGGILVAMSGCNRPTFTMPGDAMRPTIEKDEKVVFDASAYRNQSPQRWDVVALHPVNATDKEMTWALRIVGLPGEQVSFSPQGDILIGGTPLKQPARIAGLRFVRGRVAEPVAVPADSYYVLGDNTTKAYDSRYFGFLPRANILGKVFGK